MVISTEYRVVVDVPTDVWQAFRDTQEFEQLTVQAGQGCLEGGVSFYDDVFIWNIFSDLLEAKRCEAKLESVILHFKNKLNDLNLKH